MTFTPPPELPPWLQQQAVELLNQRGHAWLLHGASGLGQYALGLALVRAWLCDTPLPNRLACGHCPSCHAVDVHAHTDLCVLMPEAHMLTHGWPIEDKAQKELEDKKRKPSREIRVEAMRDAVEFAQRTSGRGHSKAVLIYPAERMNHVTANALLKTLEEPVGDVRFVLASEAAHLLLPTIRSRCIAHTMRWAPHEQALLWLGTQGLAAQDATTLLQAAGGHPEDALQLAHLLANDKGSVQAQRWHQLPQAAAHSQTALFAGFAPAQTIAVLQKICHDALALKAGHAPRFFHADDFPTSARQSDWSRLTQWARSLSHAMRSAEHPYNPGLFQEDLLAQAARALQSTRHAAG